MTVSNQTTFSSAFPFALLSTSAMSSTSSSDIFILALGVGLAAVYLFRDQLFAASKPKTAPVAAAKGMNGSGNPRDFIAKMKETVNRQ
jgi:NADPH-ferrihemoprotein reductase